MDNFWKKLKKPFTVLAPMANVTDWAFRQVILECGRPASARPEPALASRKPMAQRGSAWRRPDVFFTEFISADGICAVGKEKFKGELYFTKNEHPIVVQFFSANPEHMYRCAQLAQELGFAGVDINMGCPDKSVEKQGAGAMLIKNPELAKKIVKETIRGSGKLPVSIKTRLGFNKIEPDWIKHLLDTDIAALSIHARTRKEMSKVPAHWEELGQIAKMVKNSGKLIIGNGDVKNMADLKEKSEQYGLDGIMVGRGIFDNPWFFAQNADDADQTPIKRMGLLLKHLDNFEKLWPQGKNFDVMKRFFKIYINNWPGAKDLRAELMNTKNREEAISILNRY